VDHLCDACRTHYEQVKGYLTELGVKFVENPRMVRGLDYYTKTTFEFVHDGLGAQSGIGGGGRYDGLMAQLGGQELSGVGYGLGVDRALLAAQAEGVLPSFSRVDVIGVPLGEPARARLVAIAGELRAAGVRTDLVYGGKSMKAGFKAADKSGARLALVLGERDLEAGVVGIKTLATGEQVSVALTDVVAEVEKALGAEAAPADVAAEREALGAEAVRETP
jgi:histidyl-tRNA synthetase